MATKHPDATLFDLCFRAVEAGEQGIEAWLNEPAVPREHRQKFIDAVRDCDNVHEMSDTLGVSRAATYRRLQRLYEFIELSRREGWRAQLPLKMQNKLREWEPNPRKCLKRMSQMTPGELLELPGVGPDSLDMVLGFVDPAKLKPRKLRSRAA